jgi:hypothetical protein
LLLTPDFPPARGGIQRLLGHLVGDATRVRFRVVAPGAGVEETPPSRPPSAA